MILQAAQRFRATARHARAIRQEVRPAVGADSAKPWGTIRDLRVASGAAPSAGGLAKLSHVLLLPGAIRIKIGGEAIAAIGVGGAPGGDLDEACAKAGLDKIGGRLK